MKKKEKGESKQIYHDQLGVVAWCKLQPLGRHLGVPSFLASFSSKRSNTVALRLSEKYLYTLSHPRTTPTPKICSFSFSFFFFYAYMNCWCLVWFPSSPVLTLSPALHRYKLSLTVQSHLVKISQPTMLSLLWDRGREVAESKDAPQPVWSSCLDRQPCSQSWDLGKDCIAVPSEFHLEF